MPTMAQGLASFFPFSFVGIYGLLGTKLIMRMKPSPNVTGRKISSFLHTCIQTKRLQSKHFPSSNSWFVQQPDQALQINSSRKLLYSTRPKLHCIKVNVDGCYMDSKAGIGGLYHNHLGICHLYFSTPTRSKSPLHSEFLACLSALTLLLPH